MIRSIRMMVACAALSVAFSIGSANAGFVVGAVSVSSDKADLSPAFAITNLINQSGISANYISGVTDFDTFVATTTLSASPSSPNSGGWATTTGNTFPANIDFNFGSVLTLSRLALWNDIDIQALGTFEVFSSTDASFTNLTSLGNFTATPQAVGTLSQVFDFTNATTQFLRVRGTPVNTPNGLLNIGEFAFESIGTASAVPEPTSLALFGIGACVAGGTAARRRRLEKLQQTAA
jgi:hypothetical protein